MKRSLFLSVSTILLLLTGSVIGPKQPPGLPNHFIVETMDFEILDQGKIGDAIQLNRPINAGETFYTISYVGSN